MYAIGQFAKLTGVTPKALYHYERHGLLKPRRAGAGYRRYTPLDLLQLERIVALKALGLSLKQITLLKGDPRSVAAVMARQRGQLEEKRRRIDRAVRAIDAIERDDQPSAALDRFVGESAWDRWEAKRQALASMVARAPDRVSASRLALFHDIAAAIEHDPTGVTARPLLVRWDALLERETGGDAETASEMRKAWTNRRSWPDGMRRYVASLYEAEPAEWERVAELIEEARRRNAGETMAGSPCTPRLESGNYTTARPDDE